MLKHVSKVNLKFVAMLETIALCVVSSTLIAFSSDRTELAIRLLDERTGAIVRSADITVDGIAYRVTSKEGVGFEVRVAAGAHNIQVEASGYKTAKFSLVTDPSEDQRLVRVHLSPLKPPPELQKESMEALFRSDRATVVGFVTDEESGELLSDVHVSVLGQAIKTYTDQRGFFALQIPTFEATMDRTSPDGGPELVSLRFEKRGYRTHERTSVQITPGDNAAIYRIELRPGEGTDVVDERVYRANAASTWDPRELGAADLSPLEHEFQTERWLMASEEPRPADLVPCDASIRIGRFICRCGSGTVDVYTLERYSQFVLPREWFASWNTEALRAGAVAVRSYGAYFVQRPLCVNYDICDTTCCQVFDPNREDWRTNQAVDDTWCQKLVNADGSPYFSQYSAENNSLNRCGAGAWCTARSGSYSCGGDWCQGDGGFDGVTGQCADDDPDRGFCRYGHGRGMCQWGSQGWAQRGLDYLWVLGNYYPDVPVQ